MKSIDAAFLSQLRSSPSKPVHLVDFHINANTILSYTDYAHVLVKGGNTYNPVDIRIGDVTGEWQSGTDSVSIMFSNVNLVQSDNVTSQEYRGKRVVVDLIDADLGPGGASYIDNVYDGYVSTFSIVEREAVLECESNLSVRDRTFPRRHFGPHCAWRFASPPCGVSQTNTVTNTLVDQVVTAVDNTTTSPYIEISALSSTSDDYWNDAVIKVQNGNAAGQVRRVLDYTDSNRRLTYDVGFSNPAATTAASILGGSVSIGNTVNLLLRPHLLEDLVVSSIDITNRRLVCDDASIQLGDDYWNYSYIHFKTGNAKDERILIHDFDNANTRLIFQYPPRGSVAAGNTFDLYRNCDRSFAHCQRYGNISNYGGFRKIPEAKIQPFIGR